MSDRLGEVRAAFVDADLRQLSVAFAFGMAYGAALERERRDAEDLAVAGGAARDIRTIIDRANART